MIKLSEKLWNISLRQLAFLFVYANFLSVQIYAMNKYQIEKKKHSSCFKYGYGRVMGGYYVGGQSMDEPPASNYQNVPPGSGGNGPVGNAWEWQRLQQQLLVLRERVDQLEREASGIGMGIGDVGWG
jgi:hypothetical protein